MVLKLGYTMASSGELYQLRIPCSIPQNSKLVGLIYILGNRNYLKLRRWFQGRPRVRTTNTLSMCTYIMIHHPYFSCYHIDYIISSWMLQDPLSQHPAPPFFNPLPSMLHDESQSHLNKAQIWAGHFTDSIWPWSPIAFRAKSQIHLSLLS